MRRILISLAIFLAALASCDCLTVSLDAPDNLLRAWGKLAAAHPPPGTVRIVPSAPEATDRIVIRIGAFPGSRTVESVFLAPVAKIWEVPHPASRAAAATGSLRVVPLDSITLPDTALPFDGLFPDQPGYALVGDLAVGIQGDDPDLRAWFDSLPARAAPPAPARIAWIEAVGDIMPARGVDAALLAPDGPARVLGDTLPILHAADLLLGNLEAVAGASGVPVLKSYNFRFDPRALESLASAGFSYLSLANNHSFDFGRQGFVESLGALAASGIGTSGVGRDQNHAEAPYVVSIKGTEIRVLSFGAFPADPKGFDGRRDARAAGDAAGMLWLDDAGLAAAARAFSPQSFNIAFVHGGEEWNTRPTPQQESSYRALVNAGADLVIGSHPHVIQGLEARGGALIAYSLGNFIFPGMDGTAGGEDSIILKVGVLAGRVVAVQAFPVRLSGTAVRRAADAAAESLRRRSAALVQGG